MNRPLFLILLVASLIWIKPAFADTKTLICDGYSQYPDGRKGGAAKTALIFDLKKRLVYMKEDGEGHIMTDSTDFRIAWRSPETANRLTRSEGQFSTVTMSGREFYTYQIGGGGWTNIYENCRETSPKITTSEIKMIFACEVQSNNKRLTYVIENIPNSTNRFKQTLFKIDGKISIVDDTWTGRTTTDSIILTYDRDRRYALHVSGSGGQVAALLLKDNSVSGSGYCRLD